MVKTFLYVDPMSKRIVYFAAAGQALPRLMAVYAGESVHEYRTAELQAHEFQGVLPLNLQLQISWLFKYQDGVIVFSPPN